MTANELRIGNYAWKRDMLTGKAQKDFNKWLRSEDITGRGDQIHYDLYFEDLQFIMQYGVYLAFFDSVGIYIDLENYEEGFYFKIDSPSYTDDVYDTRTEALKEAIKQANKIYNENN